MISKWEEYWLSSRGEKSDEDRGGEKDQWYVKELFEKRDLAIIRVDRKNETKSGIGRYKRARENDENISMLYSTNEKYTCDINKWSKPKENREKQEHRQHDNDNENNDIKKKTIRNKIINRGDEWQR